MKWPFATSSSTPVPLTLPRATYPAIGAGQQNGDRRANALTWTDVMLVDAAMDVRDGYTGACNFAAQDTAYIPDADGTPFTVVFVELCQRGPSPHKRVYLDRGLPSWPADTSYARDGVKGFQ